jgi:Tol biopolymer transport system component
MGVAPVIILVAGLAAKVDQPAEAGSPGTNGKIVFSRQGGGQRLEIFAMNPDGSDQTNLTNNPALDDAPAGSPDGRRIAFLRYEEISHLSHLFVMNADGSGQRRLTKEPGPDYSATWSPDGRRIAFDREDRDVWVMNADGSGQRNLTNSPTAYDANADWSPDGARIVFESVLIASGNAEVFVMNRFSRKKLRERRKQAGKRATRARSSWKRVIRAQSSRSDSPTKSASESHTRPKREILAFSTFIRWAALERAANELERAKPKPRSKPVERGPIILGDDLKPPAPEEEPFRPHSFVDSECERCGLDLDDVRGRDHSCTPMVMV